MASKIFLFHGWASSELLRNLVNVKFFRHHIRDLSRSGIVTEKTNKGGYSRLFWYKHLIVSIPDICTLTYFDFLQKNELTM